MLWGLDSDGNFANGKAGKYRTDSLKNKFLKYMLMEDTHKTVEDLLMSELQTLHNELERETRDFEENLLSEYEKGKRLMYLFQKDLMPGVSGLVLDAKDCRDDDEKKISAAANAAHGPPTATFAAKLFAWIFLAALNISLLFYVFLFAVTQDQYRQRAWVKSFGMWMIMEVVITSSITVCFMHVFLPTLAMKDVNKIKIRLIESIAKYHQSLVQKSKESDIVLKAKGLHEDVGHKNRASDDEASEDIDSDEDDDGTNDCNQVVELNAAKYLFVSYRLAQRYPDLRIAQVILQFSTPWPRQSYQHVSIDAATQEYAGQQSYAALYRSFSIIVMFFLTSLLVIPPSIQDLVVSLCMTTTTGYMIFVHWQLYQIYPVLIAVPTLAIAAIIHFFVQSGKRARKLEIAKLLTVVPHDDEHWNDKVIDHKQFVVASAENVNHVDVIVPAQSGQNIKISTALRESKEEAKLCENRVRMEVNESVVIDEVEGDNDYSYNLSESSEEYVSPIQADEMISDNFDSISSIVLSTNSETCCEDNLIFDMNRLDKDVSSSNSSNSYILSDGSDDE